VADESTVPAPPSIVPGAGATVVVVAYGVDALMLDWVPASVPVIVVHNDDLLSPTSIDRPAVTHLFPGNNVGFGAGVNSALDRVATPRVVLCNPDIRADPRHWAALHSADPRELVVVDQVDAWGRPASVVNRYPTPAAALLMALRVGRIAPRGSRRRRWLARLLGRWGKAHADSFHTTTPGASGASHTYRLVDHWPSAALVSIDTALLRAVGGFDEDYFLYWEDVDLAQRLAVVAPEATVKVAAAPPAVHLVGGSASDAAARQTVRRQRWRSAARYAASQSGASWRLTAGILHLGSTLMARGGGAVPRIARDAGAPRPPVESRQPPDEGRPVVAVVHATRRASGETRRVAGWLDLLEEAGFDPQPVALFGDSRDGAGWPAGRSHASGHGRQPGSGAPRYSWPGWRAVGEVASGHATPETLVWNHRRATNRLEELNPHAVICVTLRAFSPAWTGRTRPVLIDLVDPLSQSYHQRSQLARSAWQRRGFAILARAAARAEERSTRRTATVAAGWTDARRLGIPWIPIIVPATATTAPGSPSGTERAESPRWHALFIGSLDYPPNIDAVERLATSIWPQVRSRLPEALLGIAGRRPVPAVLAAARHPGVEVIGEFGDFAGLAALAQVAVSPLGHTTGFQIKVLDAASAGLPQVVSPAALAGFEPGLAVRVADSDREIANALVDLLARPAEAKALAGRARVQVRAGYSVARWAPVVRSLLGELVRPDEHSATRTLAVKNSGP
jgi:GT2 family glycosyltransferase